MELKDYTTEQLREELKRRAAVEKEKKKSESRCRNCIHLVKDERYGNMYHCAVRTWGKKIVRNYCIKPCFKACDKYEKIFDSSMEYVGYLPKEFSSRKEYIEYLKEEGLAIDAPSEV